MALEREDRRLRAIQVGMLMRAYRESFSETGGARGLTQEELLVRMASVDGQYGERYSHSTVSRWESGATRPTKQRIMAFGKALDLSPVEIDGLITLAGLDARVTTPPRRTQAESIDEVDGDAHAADADGPDYPVEDVSEGQQDPSTVLSLSGAIRFCLSRFLLPGLGVAGGGYALSFFGWTADWIMTLFTAVVVGLVLTQAFLRMRRGDQLREFFFVSLFVLLNTPLLQMPLIRMDNYGFYTIGNFAGTPIPCLLALMVNLFLALAAGLMFDALWKWQYVRNLHKKKVAQRAGWVVLPPLAFVYLVVIVISNVGSWIHLTVVLPILAVVFITLLALRDPTLELRENDLRFLLWTVVTSTIILAALGGTGILVLYLVPGSLPQPDHNLLYSWDINFATLGYAREELTTKLHFGFIWVALSNFIYLVIVIGGNLIVAIYRRRGGSNSYPTMIVPGSSAVGAASETAPPQRLNSLFAPCGPS